MNVTVSDLDQDGLEDLVHMDYGNLGWHRNLGGGVMQDMGNVPGFYGPGTTVCGDLDNDGDNDVVALSNNEIASFHNVRLEVVPDVWIATRWRA